VKREITYPVSLFTLQTGILMQPLSLNRIWQLLDEIPDPEIPAVSVVELGIIRSVGLKDKNVTVLMTPTFIGCPALGVIQGEIHDHLRKAGAQEVQVKITLRPPWTSDWITPAARQKLIEFGLAPPRLHRDHTDQAFELASSCPYCGSENTELKNSFGSTLCRAIYRCNQCSQPYEQFKPV
jgi:ring-1,2-phenylacetyl-CoA epoxidase subunit PaaD